MDYALARNSVPTEEDPTPDYVDGNRVAGTTGSYPPAKFFNQVHREILRVITEAGLDPSPENLGQLYEAILILIENGGEGGGGGGPWALAARQIVAGVGLTGGGNLTADRTINLDFSDLNPEDDLENADLFAFYDESAEAMRSITWETLKELIAAAISITPGSIPGVFDVGSTIITRFDAQAPQVATWGDIVAGSTLLPDRVGTWRCQGAILGGTAWYYLVIRIS